MGIKQGILLGPLHNLHCWNSYNSRSVHQHIRCEHVHRWSYTQGSGTLHDSLDQVSRRTLKWKIKLNLSKSVDVIYTLRHQNSNLFSYYDGSQIPKLELTKYLGLDLDNRVNSKHLVRQKAGQIKLKKRQMYWLAWHYSTLNINSKILIQQSVVEPIWTYTSNSIQNFYWTAELWILLMDWI